MKHSNKAVFCFLIQPKPERSSIFTILSKLLPVAQSTHPFERFVTYVEIPPSQEAKPTFDGSIEVGDFSGSVISLHHKDMTTLFKNKMADERAARKQTGHTSHQPAELLTTNTCVVVIGSRGFCATLARIHMEELAPLRLKLIDILTALCDLNQYVPQPRISKEDLFISSVRPDAKDYITYNLCWVYEKFLRASERVDSIEERLGYKGAAADSTLDK